MAVESPVRSWDRAIGELARRQHGIVARWQLLAMGMGRGAIAGRVGRGALYEVYRGVYTVGCARISRKGRWMAAVLALGPAACLSHRSAAALWGLTTPGSRWPEVTVPRGRRGRRQGLRSHQCDLADDEWEVVDGIPVTSPLRTVLDLAAVLSRRELERVLHELAVRGLTDRMSLWDLLERYPRRRGTALLRELLLSSQPEGITRNDFEEAFVALLDREGLPRPRLNADLALRGRFVEIDCLWEEQRVALELDSRGVHATPRNFESDRQRDRILLAEGWRTMRVTWRQLRDEPQEIAADLRMAFRAPGPHPRPR